MLGIIAIVFVGNLGCGASDERAPAPIEAVPFEPQERQFDPGNATPLVPATPQTDGGAPVVIPPTVSRVGAADFYVNAVTIAKAMYPNGSKVAVISPGVDSSADLIGGAYLAAVLRVPLLLTDPATLTPATATALRELGVTQVTLISLDPFISNAVQNAITTMGISTTRIGGATRYDTQTLVMRSLGKRSNLAFIATGEDLSDASAVAGMAAALDAPLLLTKPDTLPPQTAQALVDLGIARTVVLGGPSVVSEAVFTQLPAPIRLGGADRFETNLLAADYARLLGVSPQTVLVHPCLLPLQNAMLAGAARRIQLCAPAAAMKPAALAWLTQYGRDAVLVGSTTQVTPAVAQSICDAVRCSGVAP